MRVQVCNDSPRRDPLATTAQARCPMCDSRHRNRRCTRPACSPCVARAADLYQCISFSRTSCWDSCGRIFGLSLSTLSIAWVCCDPAPASCFEPKPFVSREPCVGPQRQGGIVSGPARLDVTEGQARPNAVCAHAREGRVADGEVAGSHTTSSMCASDIRTLLVHTVYSMSL